MVRQLENRGRGPVRLQIIFPLRNGPPLQAGNGLSEQNPRVYFVRDLEAFLGVGTDSVGNSRTTGSTPRP